MKPQSGILPSPVGDGRFQRIAEMLAGPVQQIQQRQLPNISIPSTAPNQLSNDTRNTLGLPVAGIPDPIQTIPPFDALGNNIPSSVPVVEVPDSRLDDTGLAPNPHSPIPADANTNNDIGYVPQLSDIDIHSLGGGDQMDYVPNLTDREIFSLNGGNPMDYVPNLSQSEIDSLNIPVPGSLGYVPSLSGSEINSLNQGTMDYVPQLSQSEIDSLNEPVSNDSGFFKRIMENLNPSLLYDPFGFFPQQRELGSMLGNDLDYVPNLTEEEIRSLLNGAQ